jgi:hypothetical protein
MITLQKPYREVVRWDGESLLRMYVLVYCPHTKPKPEVIECRVFDGSQAEVSRPLLQSDLVKNGDIYLTETGGREL